MLLETYNELLKEDIKSEKSHKKDLSSLEEKIQMFWVCCESFLRKESP